MFQTQLHYTKSHLIDSPICYISIYTKRISCVYINYIEIQYLHSIYLRFVFHAMYIL